MSFKNKIAKAFDQKKHRTIEEIDAEYNDQALNAGHKAGIAQKLLREVENHHNRMEQLMTESQVVQKAKQRVNQIAAQKMPEAQGATA